MNPQEVVKEEILKMLQQDYGQLKQIIEDIIATRNPDRKKLGEAYFHLQKINMELYRLIGLVTYEEWIRSLPKS